MMWPREKLSGDAIFSRVARFVIDVVQSAWPSATASFTMLPSGDAL